MESPNQRQAADNAPAWVACRYPYAVEASATVSIETALPYRQWSDEYCVTLTCLADYLDCQGCTLTARDVAQCLRAYFDQALWRYCKDQEIRLFPVLHAQASMDIGLERQVCAQALLARLLDEQRALCHAWQPLRLHLEQIVAGKPTFLEADVIADFCTLYQHHLATEGETLQ